MKSLRVGIVGCGKMGREHAEAATRLGAEIAWVFDPDRSRAEALAKERGDARVIEDPTRLDRGVIDAVFVCSPPDARGPVELAAIEARLPFLVEKPIAIDAARAATILRALRERPVVHAVGYMHRYRRSVREARARVGEGRAIGVTAAWVGKPYERSWWLAPERSGGPFNEQATHFVDLCRFLVGDVVEVGAIGRPPSDRGVHDTVACALRFASGACGTLLYSFRGSEKQLGVEVFTERGRVRLAGKHLALEGSGEAGADEDVVAAEVEAFFAAVAGDRGRVLSDFEDALGTQLAVDAILRAITGGRAERVRLAREIL